MSTLREAAQAALEHWDKVSGIFRMTTETNRLRAALAQPENRPCTCHPDDNPPQPCAQRYALTECKALAQPETTAEPVAWLNRYRAAIVTQDRETANAMGFTTPLYAHPPRDEWRPASERPTGAHDVEINVIVTGHYDDIAGCWRDTECALIEQGRVIGWRDVQPPTEGER